jgi:P27 family predicted phage terminase small subunit
MKIIEESEVVLQQIPLARWIKDPKTWDKYAFIEEASQYLWDAYGSSTEQDKHALAMLAEVLETFVTCCQEIAKNGLVVIHHNGVTGKNHHVDIRDKSITKAVMLMNELGLTPKSRFPIKPKPNPELERFMRGPVGWAKDSKVE